MAYQLSSYAELMNYIFIIIFLNLLKNHTSYEKFAIQARGSKQQYMEYNQKNMV